MASLDELRQKIDGIDSELQRLLNERAHLAQQVAEVKLAANPENAVFLRPEREAQIIRAMMERNTGPMSSEALAQIFREIMSGCRALESQLKIAFLGPEGTYTHAASIKQFGHSVFGVPLATIDEVFREVEAGAAHYGVVPVENSTEGMVSHTLDSFVASRLSICGEIELRIHHHLLISEGTRPQSISRVYSHQQSLAQCRKWLDAHYPSVERVAVSSNAEAARRVKGEWHSAAIAGDMAADLYGLSRLAECIEDSPHNTTRFLVIGRDAVGPSGRDKSSIIVSTRNETGALYRILEPFYQEGISLTRIETRPSQSDIWTYVFFIDFEGHVQQENVARVLQTLRERMADVKLLGSYPQALI